MTTSVLTHTTDVFSLGFITTRGYQI